MANYVCIYSLGNLYVFEVTEVTKVSLINCMFSYTTDRRQWCLEQLFS